MVHVEYLTEDDDFDKRADHVLEEIGEVISAYGKSRRFGWASYDPTIPPVERESNRDWFLREVCDLKWAIERLFELEGRLSS